MYTHRTPQEMFNEELEHAIKVAERKYILLENEEGEETTFEESETYAEDHKAYAKYLQSLIHMSENATNGNVIAELEKIKAEIQEQIDFFKKIESFANAYGLEIANGIIKCRIAELKGE